ncbi:MAG: hypothetical protein M3546_06275 [Actinomycetota bacterium]|nr:hypothetical protein [Actinomycetota bacterium]
MGHAHTPEEQLENLLLDRRRGLEEQVARLHETVAGLEQREQLLRDSRASVERVLRVGTSDLDARESELAGTIRSVADREGQLRADETDLARRRGELGAVELKREAIEQRERALDEREERLSQRERALDEREERLSQREAASARLEPVHLGVVTLAFIPGVAYRLAELEPTTVMPGATLQLDAHDYLVARVGPSPLPGDDRRCAYLVPGVGSDASADGSS